MIKRDRKRLKPGQTFFDTLNAKMVDGAVHIVIDCDGVMTDGNSIYGYDGKCYKIYGAYDTEMLKFAKSLGYIIHFVSKDQYGLGITMMRISHLGFDTAKDFDAFDGHERAGFVHHLKHKDDKDAVTIFIGDSLSDIEAMSCADYAYCPANAADEVKDYVDYVSEKEGGHGALGEILMHIITGKQKDNILL